ncbi:MAG: TIR domain-containing protein, partial [Anaerolineales bacterium]
FGGVELYELVSIEVSPFRNICMNISLLDLNPDATRSLIAAGFGQAGESDTVRLDKLSQSIYAQAAGHPYLTQYLGDKALDYHKKSKALPVDIQSVLSALHVENSEYFDYLYQSIQKYGLTEVTKSLIEKKKGTHPDKPAIHRLGLLGVLGQRAETAYTFRNPLIEHCLAKIVFDQEPEPGIAAPQDSKPEIETQLFRKAKLREISERAYILPGMQSPEVRADLFAKAGLEKMQPELDLHGPGAEAIASLLESMDARPRLTNGRHPLGMFLTAVKGTVGPAEKGIADLIESCITQYGLMDSNREVFISYAWGGESESMVDELELALTERGLNLVRDKRALKYRGSIREFEERIGRGQCVILVISDKYLRSEHCMYELVQIAEHQEFRHRIFPIVLEDAHIYKSVGRLEYIKYWENEIDQLDTALKGVGRLTNMSGFTADLDKYGRIRARLDDLTQLLSDMNALTPEMLADNGFEALIGAIEAAQA